LSIFSKRASIVGIGATEFSKKSGRSELQLAVEAVTAALADAGLKGSDVDGLTTLTSDNNLEIEVFRNIGGKELKFFSRVSYGGGSGCALIQQAAMAVITGIADVVVCYRAMNERSEYRFGQPKVQVAPNVEASLLGYHGVHGLQTSAARAALVMRRYMYETGATTQDFARISMAARRHASTNPNAWFYQKPLTYDDYMASPLVADPLRLLDCCQESDGGVAIVVTTTERARHLIHNPVLIAGAAQGSSHGMVQMEHFYDRDITVFEEGEIVARQLYGQSGLSPSDIGAAIIYDHFGPTVLPQLEAYGFCGRGEAKDFIKNGNIEIGGRLPVNTNGGQVGEAYIHGMNGIAEAVRQVRGTAVNQVAGVANVLATSGSLIPTSAVLLSRD
jgi:acetyl-CoA acetyltransferase